tara:strand:+ start:2976 stop:3368 length:393 start_codon:yes stop_codon:yes gene_type:complete
MLKDSHFNNKPLNKGREIIRAYFRCRDYEDLLLRIEKELVCNESRGDVGFTHSTKSFNDKPSGAFLEVFPYIELNRGRLRQSKVLPTYLKEYPEVLNIRMGCSSHNRASSFPERDCISWWYLPERGTQCL